MQALSGAKVKVRGFMIPMDQAENVTQFALVPDLFACCFGQPPQVQHTVIANCPPGKAVSYYPDELVVARIWANEAPSMKRWRPRAHGRVSPQISRSSHITVVVDERRPA